MSFTSFFYPIFKSSLTDDFVVIDLPGNHQFVHDCLLDQELE